MKRCRIQVSILNSECLVGYRSPYSWSLCTRYNVVIRDIVMQCCYEQSIYIEKVIIDNWISILPYKYEQNKNLLGGLLLAQGTVSLNNKTMFIGRAEAEILIYML